MEIPTTESLAAHEIVSVKKSMKTLKNWNEN